MECPPPVTFPFRIHNLALKRRSVISERPAEPAKLSPVKCQCCARGRPIIVEWERDARHSAGLSLVRRHEAADDARSGRGRPHEPTINNGVLCARAGPLLALSQQTLCQSAIDQCSCHLHIPFNGARRRACECTHCLTLKARTRVGYASVKEFVFPDGLLQTISDLLVERFSDE
ncbi:hypothetical protein EVAR_27708_1 [Eumeta japonica]|uniref:Uncharacterized protein n=1 Tax=Eumeta variegata TaxID=151549 RepID=A0A4C1WRK8_EUMVA|nr:hypothetical protein EVAR_27708_1 [Eumeta japonica]